jgi:hypothetical protein
LKVVEKVKEERERKEWDPVNMVREERAVHSSNSVTQAMTV